ncbi:MoxR family ATPase [Hyalangium sp.]|uniref:AAA family ATPase n=1 Tax=Hyalangium sp. TaxID=2028555 RepID=UPI002D25F550|nr:MoxR family ATPase [Hyalangium sp.]HYH98953.1 MoxR family ATPase [Hyalangium sp.]
MAEAPALKYHKLFNPPRSVEPPSKEATEAGDQRRTVAYVYGDEKIVLAVNVALATQRPLLVRGPSGTGKSSLALSVADFLGWRFYEYVVTSRTQARELLWQVDLLRRLHDAQSPRRRLAEGYVPYVVPGVLWWAFDEAGARAQRSRSTSGPSLLRGRDPNLGRPHERAVVLIDEIDKADPDTPNNLLVPLGSLQFQVEETGQLVQTAPQRAPLLIITTNDERELPQAFLRRCVELRLEYPGREWLLEIGRVQLPELDEGLRTAVADALLGPKDSKPTVSAAEYVDALRGCKQLQIAAGTPAFEQLLASTIWKHGRKGPGK